MYIIVQAAVEGNSNSQAFTERQATPRPTLQRKKANSFSTEYAMDDVGCLNPKLQL